MNLKIKRKEKNFMKRTAIITDSYIRDAQVFAENPKIMHHDPNWEDYYNDVSRLSFYVGIFEGTDEDEIKNKASYFAGVHPDSISLIEPEQKIKCIDCPRQPMKPKTDDLDDNDMILCPACGYGLMAADGDYFGYPKFCSDCGQMLDWKRDNKTISEFDCLKAHFGHKTAIIIYGGDRNVSLECLDCNTVLYSVDNPDHEENH